MKKMLVDNIKDLCIALKNEFGNDINIEPENINSKVVIGTFKNEALTIYFKKNQSLIIFCDKANELIPILSTLMQNKNPIAIYELQIEQPKIISRQTTVEWHVSNPEKRLKYLLNGNGFDFEYQIQNLKLFNNRDIKSYLTKETLNKIRIYGIDPGNILNPEIFTNMSEQDLFFNLIKITAYFMDNVEYIKNNLIPDMDIKKLEYAIEYIVYQTTRFGVEFPKPAPFQHIYNNESFQNWFNHCQSYIKDLNSEQYNEFIQRLKLNKDVSMFISGNNGNIPEENKNKLF